MKRVWFGLSLVLDLSLKWVRNISKMCFILVAVGVKIHTAHHNQITNFASCFKEQRAKLLVRFVYCFPIHLSNGLHLLFQRSCCEALVSPVNGSVNILGNRVFDQAMYSCKKGFHLNGSQSLQCQESGLWNATQPECIGKHTGGNMHSFSTPFSHWKFFLFHFSGPVERKKRREGELTLRALLFTRNFFPFLSILFLYFFSFTLLKHIDLG